MKQQLKKLKYQHDFSSTQLCFFLLTCYRKKGQLLRDLQKKKSCTRLKQGGACNTSAVTLLTLIKTTLRNTEDAPSNRHHPPTLHSLPSGRLHAHPAILIRENRPRSHPQWASCTVCSLYGL